MYRKVAEAVVLVLADSRKNSGTGRHGTGVIVSEDGKILSALHVVEGASRATIKLNNGDVYDDVRVVAFDKRRDLVVLKVPGFGLPKATLGNSNDVETGDPIVLVSNPLGLERSVSQGIISGLRALEDQGHKIFQITAPASPGSSVGAIVNLKGEVIAIATSKLEGGENLNFGIPVNYARGMLPGEESITLSELGVRTMAGGSGAATSGEITVPSDQIGNAPPGSEVTYQGKRYRVKSVQPPGPVKADNPLGGYLRGARIEA